MTLDLLVVVSHPMKKKSSRVFVVYAKVNNYFKNSSFVNVTQCSMTCRPDYYGKCIKEVRYLDMK